MFGVLLFLFVVTNVALGTIFDVRDLHRKLEEGEEIGTLNKPFIFFHLEKTGGSSLRESFVHIFEEREVPFVIPCYGGLQCETNAFSLVTEELLNISSCAVAFLGHFDPTLILNALWAIDQGHYGPVECHRGWSNLQKDIGILPIGQMPPLLRGKEMQQLTLNVDCTLILREPLHQRWSFYYFFEYHRKESFTEFYTAEPKHWLFSSFVHRKLQQGMVEADFSMDNVRSLLGHCHTGVQEAYIEYYNDLIITLPALPAATSLVHHNPSTRFLDPAVAARLDANSLTPEERLTIAKRVRLDGQIWALARDVYQGHGKKATRNLAEQCDLVCWDIEGNYWLPEPPVDGVCHPCVYKEEII
jgi:hypothetical protein